MRGAHFVCGRVHTPLRCATPRISVFRKVFYTTGGSVAREPAGPVAVLRPETQATGRGVCLSGLPFLVGRSLDSWVTGRSGTSGTRGMSFVQRPRSPAEGPPLWASIFLFWKAWLCDMPSEPSGTVDGITRPETRATDKRRLLAASGILLDGLPLLFIDSKC